MRTDIENDILEDIDTEPVLTRTRLLPGWFMVINGLVLASGLISMFFLYHAISIFQKDMNTGILSTYPDFWHFRNLVAESLSVLVVVPAFMFFIQRKPAAILGIISVACGCRYHL